jgi:hypothetical protein
MSILTFKDENSSAMVLLEENGNYETNYCYYEYIVGTEMMEEHDTPTASDETQQ